MAKYIKIREALYKMGDLFDSLPTIEIVYCEDCKYSKVFALDSNEEPRRWCRRGLAKAVNDDDYCSWGEIDILDIVYPVGAHFFNPHWQGKTPTEMFGGVWKEIEPNVFERIE